MSSIDWKRGATEVLLKLYKEHPILYNMRHPKYYNKSERQMALNTIIDLLEDHRPGTTTNDILKKIQTMRTQFGQEYGKVRRAQEKGGQYVPTVWWYSYLSFLRQHIRPRNGAPELVEEDDNSYQQGEEEYETYTEVYEDENDDSEIVYEIQGKDSKEDLLGKTKMVRKSHNVSTIHNGTKEQIIFEITDADTVVPKRKHEVISAADLAAATPVKIIRSEVIASPTATPTQASLTSMPKLAVEPVGTPTVVAQTAATATPNTSASGGGGGGEHFETTSVESDRARSLGNFVAAQINGIKDDFLFYSTQMDVLNVINKALLKQLHMDKEEKAGKKATATD
uniref:Putative alcohol dehydrogenase transcription factor myb/sant-like protein n=1 Tax=Culex tarsalis TaxID=7177 RepID=A0A1Q3F0H6_CULTA